MVFAVLRVLGTTVTLLDVVLMGDPATGPPALMLMVCVAAVARYPVSDFVPRSDEGVNVRGLELEREIEGSVDV